MARNLYTLNMTRDAKGWAVNAGGITIMGRSFIPILGPLDVEAPVRKEHAKVNARR